MKIEFFDYKENCKEFKILEKATSEFATRSELKKGQILFKSIYENIVAMETKLNEIQDIVMKRKLDNFGTVVKKLPNLGKIVIKYEPEMERNFLRIVQERFEYYHGSIEPQIVEIFKFLDSEFDYENHKKWILTIEKEIKEGSINMYDKMKFQNLKRPIELSIKTVLRYYSKISLKLQEFYGLVLNLDLKINLSE